ncbi:TlpA disulfide reductase family protein [Variovorax sp. J22P240]|uniref:TlpA family protein disulfide reductase n=1 Tax=Variovorax sp. J22P240 TaxID=3053514 RepID=UPI00257726CB|nr:TlpA disulfide reductase family protein [Variovorax sp. J22P240]MDM0003095.1 TlpA disulfide reductase family protein [Variovorax sp. J22P240]
MLRRRTVLLRGAAAAVAASVGVVGAQAPVVTDNTLAPWRPARAPKLDAIELLTAQRRTLADFAGQPLLVNFWASWCGPCRVEMPTLNALVTRLGPSHGLKFIAVNHGEMPERVQRFLGEVPIAGTVLLDRSQAVFKVWGGRGLPATFVFDAMGLPRVWAEGERDWSAPALVAALQPVIAR